MNGGAVKQIELSKLWVGAGGGTHMVVFVLFVHAKARLDNVICFLFSIVGSSFPNGRLQSRETGCTVSNVGWD
ncbi:hypothetical protein OUZ56_031717 [Daphnia magna]|uniref:Uncharacterized protein n=1 Tax=Daphnia magna TaxID=35525 RepID=A0ABQ9ZVG8_9CRUS|nr:hypothetical protein OUZ56_031717 [Daphnia magna]